MHSTIDLHCHSTASDGTLAPAELVQAAYDQGVRTLALTDHDTTAGIAEARSAAARLGLELVPGIELSAQYENKPVHIVGLGIDPAAPVLTAGIEHLSTIRRSRAEAIGERLARLGFADVLADATALAGGAEVTRTHFARVLLQRVPGVSMNDVFKRYLGNGKPGYVSVEWPALAEVVSWIRGAGGQAVLAHPHAYNWTGAWRRRIVIAFKDAGGEAIEVVSGNSTPNDIFMTGGLARRYALLASVGSDFHDPATPWVQLGRFPELPSDLTPIWQAWCSAA